VQSEYLSFGGLVENRLVFAKENAVFVPRKEAGTTAQRCPIPDSVTPPASKCALDMTHIPAFL
jgi:hypothetical protein